MPEAPPRPPARFVVVTGLSGSGKSTALKALEDLGFYAVDNLPVQLLPAFVSLPVDDAFKGALVMDLRASGFEEQFPGIYRQLVESGLSLELVFLEASDEVLIRRFSETRRQHPLAEEKGDLAAAVRAEREALEPIRNLASQILDTSRFTVHQLRAEVGQLYSRLAPAASMQVNVISFGFKYGVPLEADLVMDVRFLANPYFVEDLRPLTGNDPEVVDYVFRQEATGEFLEKFLALLDFLLPRYHQEGKTRLTIGIGCTGGKHRSVAVANRLHRHLEKLQYRATLRHRDIGLG